MRTRSLIAITAAALAFFPACGDDTTNDSPDATVEASFGSVEVDDQTLAASDNVVVRSVSLVGAGFLVIHEAAGDSFGPVLGNTAVADGANADVAISLSRDLVDGETLYAMLHTDLGEVGVYEFPGADVPQVDANAAVIAPTFVVTVGAMAFGSVTVADQAVTTPTEVSISAITSVGPGFIVIHEEANGSFGPVIGNAAVVDGANTDITVPLNRDIVDGETLYAMLHTDAGTVLTYEFPGPDVPAMDANGIITPSFVVSLP